MQPLPIHFQSESAQVYQPAEDSFLLLRAAKLEVTPDDRVLEVGVGSGYVLSGLPLCRMSVGTDINPFAVKSAYYQGLQAVRTDLVAGLSPVFDLILFNPPYLPTLPQERLDDWLEYALDGGETGRISIERFLSTASGALAQGGRILLLISSLTGIDETLKIIKLAGWEVSEYLQEQVEDGELLIVYRLFRNIPLRA